MTEHGWPEHHDDIPDDDLAGLHADPPVDELPDLGPDLPGDDVWEVPEAAGPPAGAPDLPAESGPDLDLPAPDDEVAAPAGHGPPVGADPDAISEPDQPAAVFPPALDVGPLPEPVDGFPWIDTGSLGVADIAAAAAGGAPTAQELAGHAAADLPPGVDPWAALEASDDPATAALARFYRPGDTSPDS